MSCYIYKDMKMIRLCLILLFTLKCVRSQSIVGSVQCHNRKEISPCTCSYNEPTTRARAFTVQCHGVDSFSSIVSALSAQFDSNTEISLQISQSHLEDLSTLTFAQLNISIYKLSLNLNNLSEFPEEVFVGLDHVEHLSLSQNPLMTIPKHIFSHMPMIKVLDINEGNISSIQQDDFKSIPLLMFIFFLGNNISVLENGSLPNTTVKLQLSDNNLTSLNKTLRGMSDLQWLFVHNNHLDSLEEELPEGKQLKLIFLSAENNRLAEVPTDLLRCTALNILRFDHNQIKDLKARISLASNLEHLNLTMNNLTFLNSNDFEHLIRLQELLIEYNQIEFLNGALLPLKNVDYISLSHNKLVEFDFKEILGLQNLHKLDLSHNIIKTLISRTENMVGLATGLTELRLDHNHLETLGRALMNIHSLKVLNLTNNLLTSISPNDFIGLDLLDTLDISYNRLTTLEETSKTVLPSLDSLFASHNDVRSLDKDFHGLPKLCWADLTYNRIESVSTHLVEHTKCQLYGVPTTLRIYLQGNPALCQSSELEKLMQIEKFNSTKFHGGPQDCQNSLEPDLNQHPFYKKP